MKAYSSIIVTGTMAYDEIMDFPGRFKDHFHPEKLHQINISFAVDRLDKQFGGTATNIAYNLSLLINNKAIQEYGNTTISQSIHLLSSVGLDGQPLINFFQNKNINTIGVIMDKKLYTASGKVITDINDNQIWGFYYDSSALAAKISLNKYADKNSLLIISTNHPKAFLRFQTDAIKLGLDYLYDPGMSLTWINDKDLKAGISHCRWLVGNDYEIIQILKRLNCSIAELLKFGISIITTFGNKGVKYESNNSYQPRRFDKMYKDRTAAVNRIIIPSFSIKKVLDPTGAGDAWRAGFVAGVVKGLPIVDRLKLGNVLASFAIENYGTVNHKPSLKQITSRLLVI